MSTKNTVSEVLMVTDHQIGHIKGLSDKTLRMLNRDQGNAIIRGGGTYQRHYDEMLQRVLFELINMFTVVAKRVDYTRKPMEVIKASNRVEYVQEEAIANTMPCRTEGVALNVEVIFFKLGRGVGAEELEREYELRGLVPDPYAQAAVNEEDSVFVDERPNSTQWNRDGRNASYLAFDRWNDERVVYCYRCVDDWYGRWWFAGVRKVSPAASRTE